MNKQSIKYFLASYTIFTPEGEVNLLQKKHNMKNVSIVNLWMVILEAKIKKYS